MADTTTQQTADEVATIFENAQRLTTPITPPTGVTGVPVVLVPRNWAAAAVPGWTPKDPVRIERRVELHDQSSFVRYVNQFKGPGTQIFAGAKEDTVTFTAIIDYHVTGAPSHCTHTASFTPRQTVEWKRWWAVNNKHMTQIEFATFLENNTDQVVNPAGADLLQIINEFEVEGNLTFQRIQRLNNGTVKFAFNNEQKAKAGELSVPEVFALEIPIWDGEEPVGFQARLRYNLSQGGELKLRFEFINPHVQLRAGVVKLLGTVASQTKITPLLGVA